MLKSEDLEAQSRRWNLFLQKVLNLDKPLTIDRAHHTLQRNPR